MPDPTFYIQILYHPEPHRDGFDISSAPNAVHVSSKVTKVLPQSQDIAMCMGHPAGSDEK
jgi:hypothetical protein